jgi:hypothetical protein
LDLERRRLLHVVHASDEQPARLRVQAIMRVICGFPNKPTL